MQRHVVKHQPAIMHQVNAVTRPQQNHDHFRSPPRFGLTLLHLREGILKDGVDFAVATSMTGVLGEVEVSRHFWRLLSDNTQIALLYLGRALDIIEPVGQLFEQFLLQLKALGILSIRWVDLTVLGSMVIVQIQIRLSTPFSTLVFVCKHVVKMKSPFL